MKIHTYKHPLDYVVIEDFYDRNELESIWKEIIFLSDNLLPGEKTFPARNNNNESLKENTGIFLDEIYNVREVSNILNLNRKLWRNEELRDEVYKNLSHWWSLLWKCDRDTTLLNRYSNSCYYKPHTDYTVFTAVTVLYKEPANFIGGDFCFPDYDITIPKKNNMMIIFAGHTNHAVTPVSMIDEKLKNTERYSISQFVTFPGVAT